MYCNVLHFPDLDSNQLVEWKELRQPSVHVTLSWCLLSERRCWSDLAYQRRYHPQAKEGWQNIFKVPVTVSY